MEAKKQTNWEPIDFTVYLNFIKWPVLIAIILEILFRFWVNSLGSGPLFDQTELIAWLIRLGAFVIITLRSVKNFGPSVVIAVISGILSGFSIGLVVSLLRFSEGFKLWVFFNLITETITVAMVGLLTAILIVFVSNIKK